MDLVIPEGGCPICKSKLTRYRDPYDIHWRNFSLVCENKCYDYNYYDGEVNVTVFGLHFYCGGHLLNFEINSNVRKEIEYWKENDRFLIKLLE